jgi:hypothetical protein
VTNVLTYQASSAYQLSNREMLFHTRSFSGVCVVPPRF